MNVLAQKFDECGHSNPKTGQDIKMPESMEWNIIKYTGEIKQKGKVASAFQVCKHLWGTEVLK